MAVAGHTRPTMSVDLSDLTQCVGRPLIDYPELDTCPLIGRPRSRRSVAYD